MRIKGKPTLNHVAELAGVSQTSASMILNNRSDVTFSEDTIRRVQEAAKQLGYSKIAEKNKARRVFDKKTIVIFAPTLSNPYYSNLVQSIEQAARAKKYSTLIYNTYRDIENEIKTLSTLRNTDIAGIIFTFMPQAAELVETINRTIPMVVIGDRNNTVNVDTVEISNYNAGILIARHMLELGHRHIAYVSTTLNEGNSARIKRLEGLVDTFKKECPGGTVLVKSKDISPEVDLNSLLVEQTVGQELTKECLADPKITAFVAVNDMVAYGVIDVLLAQGYKVPQDYSVCGFDNIFPSQFASVSLTTVEHHIAGKGHNAFEILLNKINQTGADSPTANSITRVEYQHHLIVRGSTAPPRLAKR